MCQALFEVLVEDDSNEIWQYCNKDFILWQPQGSGHLVVHSQEGKHWPFPKKAELPHTERQRDSRCLQLEQKCHTREEQDRRKWWKRQTCRRCCQQRKTLKRRGGGRGRGEVGGVQVGRDWTCLGSVLKAVGKRVCTWRSGKKGEECGGWEIKGSEDTREDGC